MQGRNLLADDGILGSFIDINLGPKTTSYVRLIQDFQADRGYGATLNGGSGWGQYASNYDIQSAGAAYTVVHTFRHNLINETTAGINAGIPGWGRND